jgi:large subunit ribosomal protein L28
MLLPLLHIPAHLCFRGTHPPFAARRSRRIWKPNVVTKRLYSDAMGHEVQLKLTTTALRQIDRSGGLDRYLLKTPDRLLHSDVGSDLKFRIGLIYRQRWFQEAAARRRAAAEGALGLPPGGGGGAMGLLERAAAVAQQQQQKQRRQPPPQLP